MEGDALAGLVEAAGAGGGVADDEVQVGAEVDEVLADGAEVAGEFDGALQGAVRRGDAEALGAEG